MLSFGLLVSGNLGKVCLENLIVNYKINFIYTDAKSFDIIWLAENNNIPLFIGNPRKEKSIKFLSGFNTDIIFSINYLFMVEKDILNHPNKYAINFHGSLLPKYRGRTPHVWAIINDEIETGITAHLMTEGCDEGDIVDQIKIPINKETTGAEILSIYNNLYPKFLNKIIASINTNSISHQSQNDELATCYRKRTPEDGLINWNWQKERIYNWVRALAKPYPGAFTFYKSSKIIINKISFSDIGFNGDDYNGKIIRGGDRPILKTPNGAIIIDEFGCNSAITFVEGEIFNERY